MKHQTEGWGELDSSRPSVAVTRPRDDLSTGPSATPPSVDEASGPPAGHLRDRLARLLWEAGCRPVLYPVTRVCAIDEGRPLFRAVARWMSVPTLYDALLLTSRRVPMLLRAALAAHGGSPTSLTRAGLKVWCVGPATALAARNAGFDVALVASEHVAEGLLDEILDEGLPPNLRVLFPRAEHGRDLLPEALRNAGAVVDVVPAYRTEALSEGARGLVQAVVGRTVDVVTVTAGSGARSIADAWSEAQVGPWPESVAILAIGPATAGELEHLALPVHGVASPHTLPGMVLAVRNTVFGTDGTRGR